MIGMREMTSTNSHVVEMLQTIPGHVPIFREAFPDDVQPISIDNVLINFGGNMYPLFRSWRSRVRSFYRQTTMAGLRSRGR